jgi:predicted HicB family RNase H-like nuclease
MMEYKGYIGRVAFDDEAGLFHGEIINTRDVITFQGTNVEDIQREFQVSIDVYLEFCAEQNKAPDNPCSGHLVLDISPELQTAMVQTARQEHKNLDAWIVDRLTTGVNQHSRSL